MSYEKALAAAGAVVHDYKSFGSYQGDWVADVTVNGQRGFIQGSYGSCSGCDAFEAEFGWDDDEWCNAHSYDSRADCLGCQEKKAAYDKKLAAFGAGYLDFFMGYDEAIKRASEHLEWDSDAKEVVDWINARQSSKGVSDA